MKKFLVLLLAAVLCIGFTAAEEPDSAGTDRSTFMFPVSAGRAVTAENENAETVWFYTNDNEEPAACFIVPDETARLRLEIAAADDPAAMVLSDLRGNVRNVADLLDPDRNAYILEQSPEGEVPEDRGFFSGGLLYDGKLGPEDPESLRYYVIASEESLGDVEEDLRAAGAEEIRRTDEAPAREETAPEAYILHVTDQDNAPVEEVYVNFCTDMACMPAESDENGQIVFRGAPAVYHVQLIDVPDGYGYDEDFEMYIGPEYGEWVLRIRKE